MPIRSEDVERYLAFEHGKPPWPAEQPDREYEWVCHRWGHELWSISKSCLPIMPHDECQWVLR